MGTGLTGGMFVSAETVAEVGFDAAQAGLMGLARGGWLAGASREAFGELGRGLARVGPAPAVSRLVEVQFGTMATRSGSAVLPLRWQVTGAGGGLFPALDADITLAPYGESGTLIALAGVYRPPLGTIGAALDRVVLRRVAVVTVRRFVRRVEEAIADPAAATAPAAGIVERGVWRFPVVPEEA
jgi:hypothetical protein